MRKHSTGLVPILLVLLFNSIQKVNAQVYSGFKAGYNRSYLQTDISNRSFTEMKAGSGYSVEIPLRYGLNNRFYLESGLSFINKSYSVFRTGAYTGVEINYFNNYLQLPFKLGANFKLNKLIATINAGIGGSYWVSGKVKGTTPNIFNFTTIVNSNGQITDNFQLNEYSERYEFDSERDNRFEFGWLAGAGLQLPLDNMKYLFVEFNYYQSLTDQQKKYMAVQTPKYNQTYSIMIGYLIPVGNKN